MDEPTATTTNTDRARSRQLRGTRRTRIIPPWIEERRRREARIQDRAEAIGLPAPLVPGTRAHADSIDQNIVAPLIARLEMQKQLGNDGDIPF